MEGHGRVDRGQTLADRFRVARDRRVGTAQDHGISVRLASSTRR